MVVDYFTFARAFLDFLRNIVQHLRNPNQSSNGIYSKWHGQVMKGLDEGFREACRAFSMGNGGRSGKDRPLYAT